MRLSRYLQEIGYQQAVTDRQMWRTFDNNSKPVTGAHCGFHPELRCFISTHIDESRVGPLMLSGTSSSRPSRSIMGKMQ
eukprot:5884487-Prorocentrum_lima.AAC.1